MSLRPRIIDYYVDPHLAKPHRALFGGPFADAEGSAFDTFLQGSYRNGTGVADINDVDVVALYDPWRAPAAASDWQWLFKRIIAILHNSSRVSEQVRVGDKCVKLTGTLKADIVPAISPQPYSSSDPITIYSREEDRERPNYPRTYYDNGVIKQAATDGVYKAHPPGAPHWRWSEHRAAHREFMFYTAE